MGYQELIDSLRKEAHGKVQAIREKTSAEAEQIKTETSGKIKELREEFHIREMKLIREKEGALLSTAGNKALSIRLSAEKSLSDRLFNLAGSLLSELRDNRYPDNFVSLIRELPSAEWQKAKVHPEDVSIAQEHFQGVEIIPDAQITGGIEVFSEKGRQHIINTFEKRLERAWEEILPLLMSAIYKGTSTYGIPARHSG